MNKKVLLTILCLLCAAFPLAAQTAAPENMVQIPAGKFWMGRAYTIYTDSSDRGPTGKRDDRPANCMSRDGVYVHQSRGATAHLGKLLRASPGTRTPWYFPQR